MRLVSGSIVRQNDLSFSLWPETHGWKWKFLIKFGPFVSERKVDGRGDEGRDKATLAPHRVLRAVAEESAELEGNPKEIN